MVQNDIISWILSLTLVTIAIFWLWTKYRRTYTQYNIPPFPVKPWPIVGHLFVMGGNFRDKRIEWRKKAGDIYSIDIAGQLHIFVNDYITIKEIWVKKADYIINEYPNLSGELLGEYNKGITTARDDNWKEQRGTTMSILKSFETGTHLLAEKIEEEVSCVLEKLSALKGQPEDVRTLLTIFSSNIICATAIGERFEHDDPFFVPFMCEVGKMMKYIVAVSMLTPVKYLIYLPGDLFHVKKWTKAATSVTNMFCKNYVNKLSNTFNENEEPQNFVTAYIKEMQKLQKKGVKSNLSEANLISIIRTLFVGGTDSTSNTILWSLLYLLHNPEVQEKVYQEIEAIVGTARPPNMADKPKMTYLNAVIMETQRKSSLTSTGMIREVSASFEVGGYTIPKGSAIWSDLDSVHFDKKIWGDPENFRPERFIDQHGALMNPPELIPFGIGKRVCPGQSFVKSELFIFLSAIIQRFKFEPSDKSGELPSLKEVSGSTMTPSPFTLRFVDRKRLVNTDK